MALESPNDRDEEAFRRFVSQIRNSNGSTNVCSDEFPEDPVVKAWYDAIDEVGIDRLSREEWWYKVINDPQNLPVMKTHRKRFPVHYVVGRHSPWYHEKVISKDKRRSTYAIYVGPFTSNGANKIGTMQGGAQSSLFDFATGELASAYAAHPSPTAYLNVQMKKPAHPIPGVFRLDCWIDRIEGKKIYVHGKLSNGTNGKVYAEAESLIIDTRNKGRITADLSDAIKTKNRSKL